MAHPPDDAGVAQIPPAGKIAIMRGSARWLGLVIAGIGCSHGRAADPCAHGTGILEPLGTGSAAIRTVFVIVMENTNWSDLAGSPLAPYLNGTLLPAASYATQYFNPRGLHPSEPNYLWLEGGTHYGIEDNDDPAAHHLPNRDHLVSLLDQAEIPWKAYQEGISGSECPLSSQGLYAAKHDPFVYFDDVTGGLDPSSASCISHIRPLEELAADLQVGTVARYNFITPDLCHDMHGADACATLNEIHSGDTWLSQWVPAILGSSAYADGGALFIVWDESEGGDYPIGLIALSPAAKGGGYSNKIRYTHSSLLRTLQEIFGVGPLLCDAGRATSLSDLFRVYP
jgi:hypothetical protein